MKRGMTIVVSLAVFLLVCGHSHAAGGKEIQKRFEGIESIELKSVSGDCVIKTHRSDEVIVDLYYDVEPEDAFEYKFRESGNSLIIKERWHDGSRRSDVSWTLTVPAETEIEFATASGSLTVSGLSKSLEANTASGDIEIQDVSGEVEISVASGEIVVKNSRGKMKISTASGDIDMKKCGGEVKLSTASGDIEASGIEGEIKLSTASGDIDVSDSKATFKLSCASGGITAKNVEIDGPSSFSTASGEVEVILAATSQYDLELSSASGDVVLDYNGNEVEGYFEFTVKKRHGRIKCPFDFDEEEEFERDDDTYIRKSFTRKGKTPEIYMRTASGSVVLKK